MFHTPLDIRKVRGKSKRYVLLAPLVYHGSKFVTVAEGFETDLTTFWLEGRHTDASVLHDFCLRKTSMTRRECDDLMKEAMDSLAVRKLHERIIYAGIRIWARFK